MLRTIKARVEFVALTEEEVLTAISAGKLNNPIAHEVKRLADGYEHNFVEKCREWGGVPRELQLSELPSPIENVALRLVDGVVRRTFGLP